MPDDVSRSAAVWREQGLSAVVHLACSTCSAPGKYLDNAHIRDQFPACWVPREDPRFDTPVGLRCPQCGTSRAPGLIKVLGEIWRKRFYAG